MKVAVAYAIVLVLPYVVGMFPAFVVALALSWVPDRAGVPLRTFLGGCVAMVVAVGVGFLVFKWIAGAGSFGVLPYLVTILLATYFVVKDCAQYQGMKQMADDASDRVKKVLTPEIQGAGTHILGRIIGILVAGYLFVDW